MGTGASFGRSISVDPAIKLTLIAVIFLCRHATNQMKMQAAQKKTIKPS